MKAIKLTFLSPVHFGEGRLSDGVPTCDAATLFSALFIEALHGGEQDELLEAVNSGDLLISDAFPCIDGRFYVPKPMMQPRGGEGGTTADGDPRMRKAYKKLSYLPVELLPSYLGGSFDVVEELERFDTLGLSALQTKVNLERRRGPDAEPYHVGGFSFSKGAGLYFLMQGSYDLAPLLDGMCYSGLGGKRSSGYGRFTYAIESVNSFGKASNMQDGLSMLLSTAAPTELELNDALLEGARYRLVRKGGFVQSITHSATPQKKRDLYPFVAGSVFRRRFEGGVFDVNATPGAHPVYRYARAMWLEV